MIAFRKLDFTVLEDTLSKAKNGPLTLKSLAVDKKFHDKRRLLALALEGALKSRVGSDEEDSLLDALDQFLHPHPLGSKGRQAAPP